MSKWHVKPGVAEDWRWAQCG